MTITTDEIRQKYERFAGSYDMGEAVVEVLGVARLRRELLRRARGRVLEVAVGTGKNLAYYPKDVEISAVDISQAMLEMTRRRAQRLRLAVTFYVMDAERLVFPDASFDTVVSTMSLCTFPHPVTALREMARVCRPDGQMLLLEHGRSAREWLGRWQDQTAVRHAKRLGCYWNRVPLDLVHEAGLRIVSARRTFLGIFHALEVTPAAPGDIARMS